ncbi:MAG TPA: hypothetical protein VN441_15390 [Syntrophomonas sp.]|nr:hypothetical protein [Syntrophomonas sp.]
MAARIPRADKDQMRARAEDILAMHKEMIKQIEDYAAQTEVEEYKDFWKELIGANNRITVRLSRYMVTKCNR